MFHVFRVDVFVLSTRRRHNSWSDGAWSINTGIESRSSAVLSKYIKEGVYRVRYRILLKLTKRSVPTLGRSAAAAQDNKQNRHTDRGVSTPVTGGEHPYKTAVKVLAHLRSRACIPIGSAPMDEALGRAKKKKESLRVYRKANSAECPRFFFQREREKERSRYWVNARSGQNSRKRIQQGIDIITGEKIRRKTHLPNRLSSFCRFGMRSMIKKAKRKLKLTNRKILDAHARQIKKLNRMKKLMLLLFKCVCASLKTYSTWPCLPIDMQNNLWRGKCYCTFPKTVYVCYCSLHLLMLQQSLADFKQIDTDTSKTSLMCIIGRLPVAGRKLLHHTISSCLLVSLSLSISIFALHFEQSSSGRSSSSSSSIGSLSLSSLRGVKERHEMGLGLMRVWLALRSSAATSHSN